MHPELVPRHRLGRDDDRVALLDLHVRVVVVGHPRQGRHRLALAARAEDHRLLGPQELELVGLDHQLVPDLEVAEVSRDVDVLPQRAADQADLPPCLVGHVHGLLDAVDVGGEGGDEDPAFALGNQVAEDLADRALRLGHARALGVGRIAEQQVDAAVPELGELAEVGAEAVDRRVVDLVVAGRDHKPARRLQRDGDRVRDRVRHADELRLVRP